MREALLTHSIPGTLLLQLFKRWWLQSWIRPLLLLLYPCLSHSCLLGSSVLKQIQIPKKFLVSNLGIQDQTWKSVRKLANAAKISQEGQRQVSSRSLYDQRWKNINVLVERLMDILTSLPIVKIWLLYTTSLCGMIFENRGRFGFAKLRAGLRGPLCCIFCTAWITDGW